ncbi:melanoma receptor tyrosine protein kinase [Echinococcus multilocularis]|uniref:receptor protein-tyrosine kinase n=1 Tax=Echinococcus multilocularis TaxID=6211 RepID=A0A0S4MP42_ECHMU|nr:melanoma receptor tyrosine protein kinase [Echinococcus multilocularis]
MNEISGFPIDGTYEYLRKLFSSGCTHIVGNLIIYGLHLNVDGLGPDLDFLKHIEEISGFLIIMNSSVEEIPLSGLKIIRGLGSGYSLREDLPKASLLIRHTYDSGGILRKVDLGNLRVIQNGDVYVLDNPQGCNLTPGISWSDLFANPAVQHFHNSISSDPNPDDASHVESCPPLPGFLNALTFMHRQDDCISRGRCKKRNCEWCYETKGASSEEHCCDTSCLGGCTGPTNADCFVCRSLRDGNRCVDKCPPPSTVQNYRLTLNVNFSYEFNGFCVKECPKSLLTEGTKCVSECTPGHYYVLGHFCIPCHTNCPKVCSIGKFSSLDAATLASLENCTTLSGDLIISEESYNSELPGRKPITTTEELWALHSLQEVTGFVHLDLRNHPEPLKSLTFLENLRKIGGSNSRFSMAVAHGEIEFPGMHRLREAPHGAVAFMESPALCYIQTIVTTKTTDRYRFLPNFRIQMYKIPTAAECEARGAVCHPACDSTFGCWGPRREDCLLCRSHSVQGFICVESCTELPGFFEASRENVTIIPTLPPQSNPMTARLQMARMAAGHIIEEHIYSRYGDYSEDAKAPITCARCHSECAETCTGPGADQCTGSCKNARSGNECVVECPHTTFLDTERRECIPCPSLCHQRKLSSKPVCTGNGIYPGPGGCNKCEMFLEFISFDGLLKDNSDRLSKSSMRTQHGALLCMRGACPKGTFRTMETVESHSRFAQFVEEGVYTVPVCSTCHVLCRTCTGYSVLRATNTTPGCLECHGFWFKDTCVKECPEDMTFQISLTHPPEARKAFHFRQLLDGSGLFLPLRLSSPVRGTDAFPRPHLWTRHLNGHCLLCHPECLAGCWGPSASHCHRCSHVRVWRSGGHQLPGATWHPPNDVATVYLLNKEAFDPLQSELRETDSSHKMTSMYFTCEAACPEEMPYVSYDPLTGDKTCHSSADIDSAYADRRRGEFAIISSRLAAGLVGPLAASFLIFLICITLACYYKGRHKRSSNSFTGKLNAFSFSLIIDKVLRLYEGSKAGHSSRVVTYTVGSGSGMDRSEIISSNDSSSEAHGPCLDTAVNRVTWFSEGSFCQYCRDGSCSNSCDDVKSPPSTRVYRSTHWSNPQMYRRSTRQQPNMGRLVLINLDDVLLPPIKVALGSGAFGAVYKGVWRVPHDIEDIHLPTFEGRDHRRHVNVAVKILSEVNGPSDLHALLEEAKVMCSVRHRHCLQLLGVCLAGSQRYLVSEYIANGSLDGYIRRSRNDLPHWLLLLWAEQIAEGMAYLQSVGIIHRDLATRNVLVKEREWVQITDFGLAKMLNGEEEEIGEVIVQSGRVPIRWLAIETLTSGRYSFKTDIWAYGVTLWEIFTFGQRPYPTIETKDVKRYVLTGGRLLQPDICTLEAYQRLLLACWRENPDERVSFDDILQLLRSKMDMPEYFLHSRQANSVISTQTHTTRLSGAYSEAARRDRDYASSPPNALSTVASSSFSSFPLPMATAASSACQRQQRSTLLSQLPPRFPQNPIETQDSLPGTVEYTTATNSRNSSSADNSSAERQESPIPAGSGGYVWPVPFTEHAEGVTGGGEYVGPLFQRSTDATDL